MAVLFEKMRAHVETAEQGKIEREAEAIKRAATKRNTIREVLEGFHRTEEQASSLMSQIGIADQVKHVWLRDKSWRSSLRTRYTARTLSHLVRLGELPASATQRNFSFAQLEMEQRGERHETHRWLGVHTVEDIPGRAERFGVRLFAAEYDADNAIEIGNFSLTTDSVGGLKQYLSGELEPYPLWQRDLEAHVSAYTLPNTQASLTEINGMFGLIETQIQDPEQIIVRT
jgi:hypothetical protein